MTTNSFCNPPEARAATHAHSVAMQMIARCHSNQAPLSGVITIGNRPAASAIAGVLAEHDILKGAPSLAWPRAR